MYQKAFVRLDLPRRNDRSNQSLFPQMNTVNELYHSQRFPLSCGYNNNSWCVIAIDKAAKCTKDGQCDCVHGIKHNDPDLHYLQSWHLVSVLWHFRWILSATARMQQMFNRLTMDHQMLLCFARLLLRLHCLTPLPLLCYPHSTTPQMEIGMKIIMLMFHSTLHSGKFCSVHRRCDCQENLECCSLLESHPQSAFFFFFTTETH